VDTAENAGEIHKQKPDELETLDSDSSQSSDSDEDITQFNESNPKTVCEHESSKSNENKSIESTICQEKLPSVLTNDSNSHADLSMNDVASEVTLNYENDLECPKTPGSNIAELFFPKLVTETSNLVL